MAAKDWIVEHDFVDGHARGSRYTPAEHVDVERLTRIGAIRKATDDEQEALNRTGTTNPDAEVWGVAPEGQVRVNKDTFADKSILSGTPANQLPLSKDELAKAERDAKSVK